MVGYEYEYRAAEPFFASEALEEEPEGIVDIGYALVQFRVTGREFVLVLCRDCLLYTSPSPRDCS